ncbi:MAG: AAA family ATPase [Rhodococcus sp. (in: high G+C Gram-positive bacteria)]|uniref:ATP-dependent nuclease n=1 Tax=Rhodococcus sp. TaxID=1831 RepID=UPI003BB10A52
MHIHELAIENFRGIRSFTQRFEPGLSAIIGAGDNGKTTILDALTVLFHPNWSLNLTDNDFYDGDPEKNPIRVSATVVDPPDELTRDQDFLSYLRGVDLRTGEIVDEPDDHTTALTCELTVGPDFEPVWKIVCDRHSEGKTISAAKRQKFGVRRIDASDHHLKWVRNSALHQLSDDSAGKSTDTVLRDVSREARTSASAKLSPFDAEIESIRDQARMLRAVSDTALFSAELDADLTALTRGSISLHMDGRPVSRTGLGSRRLVTVGVQSLAQAGAHILLIDELESGLEPHRTRHLIRYLQRVDDRQVLLTTHSPTVVRELDYGQLKIARRTTDPKATGAKDGTTATATTEPNATDQPASGTVTLVTPPPEAQGPIRTHADGFLAPRVLVCEGATEVGFIRGLCNRLEDDDPARMSFVASVDANGDSKMVEPALVFHNLGYTVGVFCDFDRPKIDLSPLDDTGITLLRCDKGNAIEQQVLGTLTAAGIRAAIEHAIDEVGRDAVLSSLDNSGIQHDVSMALADSQEVDNPEQYQTQISVAAGKGEWFKRLSRGEKMAEIVLDPTLTTMTPQLEAFLDKLRHWCAPQ